ncbi:hypothetical protein [Flavisolibacter nicotianae]|uniref:hypothetical protein n=1 Tax=Flavisolibacter nicotianae TaxID=2364882 RepID=UPI000EAED93C|nr:hypothetical protein [Flavisolibacter nicotianae]
MQESLFPSTVTQKLYNERAILIGTFVGGPLAGGYLLARNFAALNQPGRAGKTWMATIGVLLLLIASSFIPLADKIPPVVYGFALGWTAHFVARKYQGSNLALHRENGGQFYSTWRAVFTGVVSLLLLVGFVLGLFYLQDQLAG